MNKDVVILIITAAVVGILLFGCGFIVGFKLNAPDHVEDVQKATEQLATDLRRVRELEEYYHEEIRNLPDCKYDPTTYNRLFNRNAN